MERMMIETDDQNTPISSIEVPLAWQKKSGRIEISHFKAKNRYGHTDTKTEFNRLYDRIG